MKFKTLITSTFVFLLVGVLAVPPITLSGRTPPQVQDSLLVINGKLLRSALLVSPNVNSGLTSYWKFWCLRQKNCDWSRDSPVPEFNIYQERFGGRPEQSQ